MEQTLCIIKPDAVKNSFVDEINKIIEDNNLLILKSKKLKFQKILQKVFILSTKKDLFFLN